MDVAGRLVAKPPCDVCKSIRADMGKEPPCEKCMPALHPLNREAWDVYQFASGQVIAGMGGAIDLDFRGLEIAMNVLEIPEERWREVFRKALEFGRTVMELQKKKGGGGDG